LKLAVSGVTELLRVFSFSGKERYLPYYSPSSIAFSGCFWGRCPETNKMKQNPLPKLLLLNAVLRVEDELWHWHVKRMSFDCVFFSKRGQGPTLWILRGYVCVVQGFEKILETKQRNTKPSLKKLLLLDAVLRGKENWWHWQHKNINS